MKRKGLTPREKDFCRRYICCGNSSEAAAAAGYEKSPAKSGEELLSREDITAEISRLCTLKKQTVTELARVGYQRLAFGSIADAVSLLYMDNPTSSQLEKMDLFSVSEIKRPKDGSMEIKFFDRLKALEKLCEGVSKEEGAPPIYDAIVRGALALRKSEECDSES